VAMRLVGANPEGDVSGMEQLEGKSNYFIGNDPMMWRTDIPNYAKVRYGNVYPGVDLVYYGRQGRLEYDFLVAAGGDPRAIRVAFEPIDREPAKGLHRAPASLRINGSGDLLVSQHGGEMRLGKPTAYQLIPDRRQGTTNGGTRHLIETEYVLESDGQVGLRVAPYDTTKVLVIDPVLTYSTRLGGSGQDDMGASIAVDNASNVYVTGTADSLDFPVVNPISGSCPGACGTFSVAYITKINAAGNALVYSSLVGGSNFSEGLGINVDGFGNAYLVGLTSSADFPRVNQIAGACLGTCGQGMNQDVFVTKISSAGNALL
jgi:hypothetical protein